MNPTPIAAAAQSSRPDEPVALAFIDAALPHRQHLLDAIPPGMAVVVLTAEGDPLAQAAQAVAAHAPVGALHLLTHGFAGGLQLGGCRVGLPTLRERAETFAAIGAGLAPDADILVYGCEVASGPGPAFLHALAEATGADVAASRTLTGAAELGGDWTLDWTSGAVATAALAMPAYPGVLAAPELKRVIDNVGAVRGELKSGDTTDDTRLALVGKGDPHAVVEIYDGETLLGTADVGDDGLWLFHTPWLKLFHKDAPALPDTYAFRLKYEQGTAYSEPFHVTIDAPYPLAPQTPGRPGASVGEVKNYSAFAALKADGSVVTWGSPNWGGNAPTAVTDAVTDADSRVVQVFSTYYAFAALKADGSVVTWGSPNLGGNAPAAVTDPVTDADSRVVQVFSTNYAFAALKADGSVVTWGDGPYGGDSTGKDLTDVVQVFSTFAAFAALKDDGSVVTWGDDFYGGDSTGKDLTDVVQVFSNDWAFAALKADGSVVTWGDPNWGGNAPAAVTDAVTDADSRVVQIFSNDWAFAALKADGSVVTWGRENHGGNAPAAVTDADSRVVQVFSTGSAFAALKADGSVVTWGNTSWGGDSTGKDLADIVTIGNIHGGRVPLDPDPGIVYTIDDAAGPNTGQLKDGDLTDEATPKLSGTGQPGAIVSIYSGETFLASVRVNDEGKWEYKPDSALDDGQYALSIRVFDARGTFVGRSETTSIGIVTGPPKLDRVIDTVGAVQGDLTSGDTTDDTRLALVGTGGAGLDVEIYDGADLLGKATVGADGFWLFHTPWLKDGQTYALRVKYEGDAAYTEPFDVTIDAPYPLAPQTPGRPGASVGEVKNNYAFAALKADGSVVTWGDPSLGGNAPAAVTDAVTDAGSRVVQVFSTGYAFAALKADGSVVTWGNINNGGNAPAAVTDAVTAADSRVVQIFSTQAAFAALKADGSVVTWGHTDFGGNAPAAVTDAVTDADSPVVQVFSTDAAFAALKADGSVVTWGDPSRGGNAPAAVTDAVTDADSPVVQVFSTYSAFAALKADGSVVTWGDPSRGGNAPAAVTDAVTDADSPVVQVFSTGFAFAALKADGSVVTWGDTSWGGDSTDKDLADIVTIGNIHGGRVPLDPDPGIVYIIDDDIGPNIGQLKDGDLTDDATPLLAGTGQPGATVSIFNGETFLASVRVNDEGKWAYKPDSALDDGQYALSIRVFDTALGAFRQSQPMSIEILTVPKVTTSDGTTDFVEPDGPNDAPEAIDPGLTLALVDGQPPVSATVRITGNFMPGEDVLTFVNDDAALYGDITATYDAQTGTLTLTSAGAAASLAQWQAALRAVTYNNTSDTPSADSRTISFVAHDGTNASAAATRTVEITATNDTPEITAPQDGITVAEDAATPLTGIRIDDADSDEVSVTLSVDSGSLSFFGDPSPTPTWVLLDYPLAVVKDHLAKGAFAFIPEAGAVGPVTLTVTVTDDGNGEPANAKSVTDIITLTVEPAIPVVTQVSASEPDGLYKAGDEIDIVVSFSRAVTVDTTNGNPTLLLATGMDDAGVATYVAGAGGSTLTFRYTVRAGEASGDLDYLSSAALVLNGAAIQSASSGATATLALPAPGGPGSLGANAAIVIDGIAPAAPPQPELHLDSDSGVRDDGITNDTTPTITGTAEAGSTVTLYDTDGTTVLGTATADAIGAWSITSAALADGLHRLSVTATDAAGNVSQASVPLDLVIDTIAPSAPVLTLLGDGLTNNVTPTITGTAEAGSTVTLYGTDGTTVLGSTTADATGMWSITSSALADGTHSLTVKATDAAGNESVASPALDLVIDTAAPDAPTQPELHSDSDSGVRDDGITNVNTPTITGFAEAGSTITLYDTDGTTVLGTAVADAVTGVWSITSTALADGAHSLTVKATDAAGNESMASPALDLVIDTAAPAAPPLPELHLDSDSGVRDDGLTNDNTPTITGTAEPGSTITLYGTDGTTVLGTAVADAVTGTWSITSTALADGLHSLSVTATDAAGNVSLLSDSLEVTIDTAAPDAPALPALDPGSDSGVRDDGITNVSTPTITGTAEAGSTVTLYGTDGTIVLGSTTADATGAWSITSTALADGTHSLTVKATDAAGNESVASPALDLVIDTAAPDVPPQPELHLDSDSGVRDDGITNVSTPTITGFAEAGSTVTLYGTDGTTVLGTAVADAVTGAWSITSTALADGAHSLTVKATDAAGNVSQASPALDLVIDTTAPATPAAPALDPGSDSGTPDDDITNNTTPTITGTAEAGSTVTLYGTDGTIVLGTATADAIGAWSITSSALADGTHSLTVKATDAAGNVSQASPALDLVIDTTAPATPAAPVLDAGSDSGTPDDGITNNTTPTITGTAEAGSTVTLYGTDGTIVLGTATADATGTWSITSAALTDGSHSLSVTATDAAGNVSQASPALDLVIDTTAPATPALPALDPGSDSGVRDDGITNVSTPTITGTAEPGSTITLYGTDGTTVLGTASADAGTGAWSITSAVLADGAHSLTITATDAAGNVSQASPALDLVIDTTPPPAPSLSASANGPTWLLAVSGLEVGASWQYRVGDEGAWHSGTGASFSLPLADYAPGRIQVRQIDAAGNLSAPGSNPQALTPVAPPAPSPIDAPDYDGNGDGIPDAEQPNVMSMAWGQSPDGTPHYVTLVVHDGARLQALDPLVLDAAGLPDGLALPFGALTVTVTDLPESGVASFSLFLDPVSSVNGYWKQIDGQWVNIADTIDTQGERLRIDFSVEDGGAFDADSLPGSLVVLPGAPGWFDGNPDDLDADQIPDRVEIEMGLTPGVKDNDVFARDDLFVMQAYRDALGREADPDGLVYWQGLIERGAASRTDVILALLDSDEARQGLIGVLDIVQGLGAHDDLAHWRAVWAEHDGSREALADAIVTDHYGSVSDTAYVDALYRDVLGREADAPGHAYWTDALGAGTTRGELALTMLGSQEYQSAHAGQDAIAALYAGLLGRAGDDEGLAYWAGALADGVDQASVALAIIGSAEYHARFLSAADDAG